MAQSVTVRYLNRWSGDVEVFFSTGGPVEMTADQYEAIRQFRADEALKWVTEELERYSQLSEYTACETYRHEGAVSVLEKMQDLLRARS